MIKTKTNFYLLPLKNAKPTRYYGPIYIDFDDYPPYTDATSEFFEAKNNYNIKRCCGYP